MVNNVLIPLPKKIQAALNRGFRLQNNGNLSGAEQICHQILNLAPDHADALHLLGTIRLAQGRHGTAFTLISRALETAPSPHPRFYFNFAIALERLNRIDEAIEAYHKAIELKEDFWNAWLHCIQLYLMGGRLGKALEMAETALKKRPEAVLILALSGEALMQLGRHDDAETTFRKALAIRPNLPAAIQNLMLNAHYMPGMTLERLLKYHREFHGYVRAAKPAPKPQFQQSRNPERTLRIGFVSSDFRRHPIGYFMAPFLPYLDKNEIRTTCYSDNPNNDDMTGHVRSGADQWVEIKSLDHGALAEKIQQDRIDILFDMGGHTGKSRLMAFAGKPAPIQITWAGYVGTTGLEEMDYIVADHFHIRKDEEKFYMEKVLRISECNFVVRPPDFAPEVAPLPARGNGYVTFGTFSIPTKINPQIVKVWCKIMSRVENSRMMLKYRAMDDPANIKRIKGLFQADGIDPSRLLFYGSTPHVDLLNHYNRIDIALDPAPYSGGLTTCEALWMGTPVVTCPGPTFGGRHAQSILSCVGLMETIGEDSDQYVDIAVELAGDLPRLAEISAGLRQQMKNSPLVDGGSFAGKFSAAMRSVWTDWCQADCPDRLATSNFIYPQQ